MTTRTPCTHRPTKLVWDAADTELDEALGIEPGWCPDYLGWFAERLCEHGNCTLEMCPQCLRVFGARSVQDCPCYDYPSCWSQRPRPRNFDGLKPCLARRRSGRHRARPRKH